MPSTASWLAWLNASILRRWYAISASRSNGRKRKSAIILLTSKSKKVGRASDMNRFRSGGASGYCALHNESHIGPYVVAVKSFLALQQFQTEIGSPPERGP